MALWWTTRISGTGANQTQHLFVEEVNVSQQELGRAVGRVPKTDGSMSEFEDVTDSLKRVVEEAAREALNGQFEKLGLQFINLHPTIRAIMERAAISTGDAAQQVESFVRLVAMADQYNLTEEQKEYALVKAYEQHGERLAKSEKVGGSGQDEATSQPSPTDPSEAPVPDGPPDSQN
jgi:hypothetical protein